MADAGKTASVQLERDWIVKSTLKIGRHDFRLIDLGEVCKKTGCGKTSTYEGVRAKTFPAPVKIGASSRWVEREVDAWIAARVAERDTKTAA